MKRSRLTYDSWTCILSRDLIIKKLEAPGERGHLVLNRIKEVTEPQTWEFNGEDIVVCDKGIQWLSFLPQEDHYCITAMLDAEGEVIVWYIDMIASQGMDESGIPYFDDLYLDLVVYPDGTILVDDMDELEEAYESGDISKELYDLALKTSDKLQKGLLTSIDHFKAVTQRYYTILKESIRFRADKKNSLYKR